MFDRGLPSLFSMVSSSSISYPTLAQVGSSNGDTETPQFVDYMMQWQFYKEKLDLMTMSLTSYTKHLMARVHGPLWLEICDNCNI
jgi:hypothetical protein